MSSAVNKFFCLLMLGLQIFFAAGVAQGSTFCRNVQTGQTHLENVAEQAACHFSGSDPFDTFESHSISDAALSSAQDCIDTPVAQPNSSAKRALSSADLLQLAHTFVALPAIYISVDLAAVSPSWISTLAERSTEQSPALLRSVILVV